MKKLISLILLFLFYIFSAGGAFAQNAKITGRLLALAQETQNKFLAKQVDSPKVKVLFYPAGQKSSNVDFKWFKSRNIQYQASKNYVSAKIDASLISELANISGVEVIDIAFPPNLYSSIGEGVYKINASKYDGGRGVKLAIIDVREPGGGFKNYKTLQAKGELPKTVQTADFVDCADPLNPREINPGIEMGNHGTACAEIIYDVAPQVEMYLMVIDDIVSFQNAVDYCVLKGINIASISLGWTRTLFYYEGDGSEGSKVGYGSSGIALCIDDAADKGLLSVIAAGNEGPAPNSLTTPGDARKALTVGAIYYGNYDKGIIEYYSSRGPVKAYDDGTISLSSATKPEITAPAGISSVALGGGFFGTSAATPHAAGAAALLLGWFSALNSPQSLKDEIITKYAKPVAGQTLPNDTFGYGRLILDDNLVPVINTGNIIVYPNPVSVSRKDSVKIANIPINTRIYSINIFTVTGQFVRNLDFANATTDFINGEERKVLTWDLKNQSGSKVAPGVYFAVVDALTKGKMVRKIAVQK